MKSSYELAMERLNKTSPTMKLSNAQKEQLADLDSRYLAKIAERELAAKAEIAKCVDRGDYDSLSQCEQRLVHERKALQAELEEKKELVRNPAT